MNRRIALGSALVMVGSMGVGPQTVVPDRMERLAQLAELDGAVRYFHPEVVSGRVHWDSVFAPRILALAKAPTPELLHDLFARIDNGATFAASGERDSWIAFIGDSTVVLKPGAGHIAAAALRPQVDGAASLVIDLRGRTDAPPDSIVAAVAVAGTATAPPIRSVTYDGFAAASGVTTARYVIRARQIPGESFTGTARPTLRVVFLADDRSILPPVALALRAQGRAFVVTTGAQYVAVASGAYRMQFGPWTLSIRTGDRAGIQGARIQADTVISSGQFAADVAADFSRRTSMRVSLSPQVIDSLEIIRPLPSPTYAAWTAAMPSAGFRLLSAFRLWNTIHHFSPYKHVMGSDWNAALRTALPRVETARDSAEFALAIAAFASKLNDSHVGTNSESFRATYGVAAAGVRVRFIENQLVVVKLPVDSIAARTGLRAGDVVLSVDGERIDNRVRRMSQYFSASTPQGLRRRLSSIILNGAEGSVATLTVRDSLNKQRVIGVPRSAAFNAMIEAKLRAGTSLFRILPGNIGYADLDRIPPDLVDTMFATLRATRAIIFDMRGYPLGTAQFIAQRIALTDTTTTAVYRRLMVSSPDTTQTTTFRFTQAIPPLGSAEKYTGKTVMLIDERAISQAENTGLWLTAANGTRLIGSPTTGANGDVTNFSVPGGINITFTGHDVRYADGTQLQRVGLKPDIYVAPTIAGIRAGRDEVLEAAFRSLGGVGAIPKDTGTDRMARPPRAVTSALPSERAADQWTSAGATRAGLDEGTSHTGTRSGHITVLSPSASGVATLSQPIRAEGFAGKRVRFRAYIRSAPSADGMAMPYLLVLSDTTTLTNSANAVAPSGDWVRAELVFDVPANAFGMRVGLSLKGVGEAWIDDASLEEVGHEVPVSLGIESRPVTFDRTTIERQRTAFTLYQGRLGNVDFERRRGGQ